MNKLFFLFSILLISISSCKHKHHNDPSPAKPAEPVVTYWRDVRLYNQFYSTNNFFSIRDSVFITDKTANFDLCYSNIAIGSAPAKNYFVLGSPADKTYTDKAYPGLTSSNASAFYKVPASFSYADFDTLTHGSGLKAFIDHNCTLIYSNSDILLSQAVRSEDSYGWGPNTVFAYKTQDGRYGMLKILAAPSGSATEKDPTKKAGLIRLDIKIQK